MSPTGVYIRTKEHKEKISKALMGNQHSLGYSHSKEHKKKTSESLKGRYTGENSSQWKGGISSRKYPYEFLRSGLREKIRERDNYICQLCGKEQGVKKLDVHHIDYDRENSDVKNLITLCRSCNMEVESNREVWICIFKRKIKNIYKQIRLMEKRK